MGEHRRGGAVTLMAERGTVQQRANGQLEKTNRVGIVRRDIARIMTIMNEQRQKAG